MPAAASSPRPRTPNEDPRRQRSYIAYRRALAQLLKHKPLDQITVSELSQAAGLNRTTFYLHYTNVAELYDEIEAEMLRDFQERLARLQRSMGLDSLRFLDPNDEPSHSLLTETFTFIQHNADFASLILANPTRSRLLRLVVESGRETSMKIWQPYLKPETASYYDHYYTFLAAGFIGVILTWLEDGMRMSPRDLATLCMNFIHRGMNLD